MLDESNLKYWQDAGHVARRTLEAIKDEITVGKTWHSVIESAERFIRRNGGNPAFPATIAVTTWFGGYASLTVHAPSKNTGDGRLTNASGA